MVKLREKAKSIDCLWEEVDRYGLLSTLVAQVTRLKASLVEGERRWKKASKYATEACREFEAVHKVLK